MTIQTPTLNTRNTSMVSSTNDLLSAIASNLVVTNGSLDLKNLG